MNWIVKCYHKIMGKSNIKVDQIITGPLTANYCMTVRKEDDLMTIPNFKRMVSDFKLNEFDGVARPVKDNLIDSMYSIYPKQLDKIPVDATHIVWYSR